MKTDYCELLIGCGRARDKRLFVPGTDPVKWSALTTLDCNPDVRPDILVDLDRVPWFAPQANSSLARILDSSRFDEIHAYEVLEHLGTQGDIRAFFAFFSECWRVLKPGGHLLATCPSRYSSWLWGDPGHTRAILPQSLIFLDQEQYEKQCDSGHPRPMSDYRYLYKGDFKTLFQVDNRETFSFILQAVKPSRFKG